jgi:hypothetical protein
MGILISSSDFVGKYAVPQDSFSDLDGFIDELEEGYLIDLMGVDFYNSFITSMTGSPPLPVAPYLIIYNKLFLDIGCTQIRSEGMVKMLLGFMYFEYMRSDKFKATTQGIVINAPDTSKPVPYGSIYKFYNDAVTTFQAIQYYICTHQSDYTPKFNGIEKGYAIPMFQ